MKPQYNTEDLIKNIKLSCSVPTSQLTYTDSDFTDIANRCLQTKVVPLVMSTREEFFVEYEDVGTTADGVIPIPGNAVGSKLRTVSFVQQENPLVLVNLPRINLDVVAGVGFFNFATLAGFYVQGNDLVLYPNTAVPVNSRLRLYYYRRTLHLAAPEEYGRVTAIDVDAKTVTLNNIPVDWVVGSELNSVASTPNFKVTSILTTITALNAPSITLDSVEGISVGDYLSFEGFSAIPQIPIEAHNFLAQVSAVDCLEGLGDRAGMQVAQAKADQLEKSLLVMISNRVDGSPKKLVNPDGGMRLWSGIGSRRRGGWGW